jgi:hypothetical protein
MRGTLRRSIIISAIIVILLIIGFVLAALFNVLLDVLYIVLIILAALTLLSTIYLTYAVFVLIQTITMVRNELKPLFASVQETVGIVKDTAKSAGQTATTIGSTAQLTKEFALGPSVRAVSALVATQQMVRVFLGKGRTQSRMEKRRRQQMEAGAGGGE